MMTVSEAKLFPDFPSTLISNDNVEEVKDAIVRWAQSVATPDLNLGALAYLLLDKDLKKYRRTFDMGTRQPIITSEGKYVYHAKVELVLMPTAPGAAASPDIQAQYTKDLAMAEKMLHIFPRVARVGITSIIPTEDLALFTLPNGLQFGDVSALFYEVLKVYGSKSEGEIKKIAASLHMKLAAGATPRQLLAHSRRFLRQHDKLDGINQGLPSQLLRQTYESSLTQHRQALAAAELFRRTHPGMDLESLEILFAFIALQLEESAVIISSDNDVETTKYANSATAASATTDSTLQLILQRMDAMEGFANAAAAVPHAKRADKRSDNPKRPGLINPPQVQPDNNLRPYMDFAAHPKHDGTGYGYRDRAPEHPFECKHWNHSWNSNHGTKDCPDGGAMFSVRPKNVKPLP